MGIRKNKLFKRYYLLIRILKYHKAKPLPVKLLGYIEPRFNLQVNNLEVFLGVAGESIHFEYFF